MSVTVTVYWCIRHIVTARLGQMQHQPEQPRQPQLTHSTILPYTHTHTHTHTHTIYTTQQGTDTIRTSELNVYKELNCHTEMVPHSVLFWNVVMRKNHRNLLNCNITNVHIHILPTELFHFSCFDNEWPWSDIHSYECYMNFYLVDN